MFRAKECSAISAKVIATCFALVGFAGCIVVGYVAGNSTATILMRALGMSIVCWLIGYVVGAIGQRTIEENIANYKQANPIPKDHDSEGAITAPESEEQPQQEGIESRPAA